MCSFGPRSDKHTGNISSSILDFKRTPLATFSNFNFIQLGAMYFSPAVHICVSFLKFFGIKKSTKKQSQGCGEGCES